MRQLDSLKLLDAERKMNDPKGKVEIQLLQAAENVAAKQFLVDLEECYLWMEKNLKPLF